MAKPARIKRQVICSLGTVDDEFFAFELLENKRLHVFFSESATEARSDLEIRRGQEMQIGRYVVIYKTSENLPRYICVKRQGESVLKILIQFGVPELDEVKALTILAQQNTFKSMFFLAEETHILFFQDLYEED